MKTNFLLIWTASHFPLVMRLLVPASGPWSPLPPLSAHSPTLPQLCVRRIPWGSLEAGGNADQDAKNRDEEHGNWEKGRYDIQEKCARCHSNYFSFPISPQKDFRACFSISKGIWAEEGMLAQPISVRWREGNMRRQQRKIPSPSDASASFHFTLPVPVPSLSVAALPPGASCPIPCLLWLHAATSEHTRGSVLLPDVTSGCWLVIFIRRNRNSANALLCLQSDVQRHFWSVDLNNLAF